jgi:2'-5' RNA ligase
MFLINEYSTMPSRVIYLTLDLPQEDQIQSIREQFDPLAGSVPPHITLVFPFESEIETDLLVEQIDQAIDELDFEYVEISLDRAIIVGQFCFLPIEEGRDQISDLHDLLYGGILETFLSEEEDYIPHLTIGRCSSEVEAEEIRLAADAINLKPTGAIRSIILERMHEDDSSHTEYERNLRPDTPET